MENQFRRLLDELDAELAGHAERNQTLDLYMIGRSALIFYYGAKGFSTKDLDVVALGESDLEPLAANLFGAGSARAVAIGTYLEFVPQGLPPLPTAFANAARQFPGRGKSYAFGNSKLTIMQQLNSNASAPRTAKISSSFAITATLKPPN